MYVIGCRKLGLDCDFTLKKSDRNNLVNNFCKHLLTHHKKNYPTKEILGFIQDQKKSKFADKFYSQRHVESPDPPRLSKWFLGRKNFP